MPLPLGKLIGILSLAAAAASLVPGSSSQLEAQAPLGIFGGKWAEAGVIAHSVSEDLGDWRGIYARTVIPTGERQTIWVEATALEAFRERGFQAGLAHRYDWTGRFFHLAGVTASDGSPIFPQLRADLLAGVKLGSSKSVVATAGVSHVRSSIDEMTDAAFTAGLAWYAPKGLVLEAGLRANTGWPGTVKTNRYSGTASWYGERRSLTLRGIAGEEGWQYMGAAQGVQVRFSSHELSLAWRERLSSRWSSAVQIDRYENPTYTRTGLSAGLARSW